MEFNSAALRKLFESRRSIRKYKRAATLEELRKIVELARLAPSAKNMQPWKVSLVTDPDLRVKIRDEVCRGREFIAQASLILIWTEPAIAYKSWRAVDGDNTADVDAAIFTTYAILAAKSLGLGSCWIAAFDEDKIFDIFPDKKRKYRLFAILTVGEPAEEPVPRGRKSVDEIILEER